MEFPVDLWMPLLVEVTCTRTHTCDSNHTSAWSRFARHALFDRNLLCSIERARCSSIVVSIFEASDPHNPNIECMGPLREKAGFWVAGFHDWDIHPFWNWKHRAAAAAVPRKVGRYNRKPLFDYMANYWVVFSLTGDVMYISETGARVWVRHFAVAKYHASLEMDIGARRIYVLVDRVLHTLAADGQLLHSVCCDKLLPADLSTFNASNLAIDPIRHALYLCASGKLVCWQEGVCTVVALQQCDPDDDFDMMVVHPRTGMIAHATCDETLCVHWPDGRFVRKVPTVRIQDMFVNAHLDVLCIASGVTVAFVACSTVFAPE